MSALELRNQGNKLFAARKYDDAIACYTKAIVSDGSRKTSETLGCAFLLFSEAFVCICFVSESSRLYLIPLPQ